MASHNTIQKPRPHVVSRMGLLDFPVCVTSYTMKDRRILPLSIIALAEVAFLVCLIVQNAPEAHKSAPVLKSVTDPRFIAPQRYRADVSAAASFYGIPQDIAIRLAFEESGWTEGLVSKNRNGTYDHNIYQMNSRTFSVKLTRAHIWEAMRHFSVCWKLGGSLRKAVIVWNAGLAGSKHPSARTLRLAGRVTSGGM